MTRRPQVSSGKARKLTDLRVDQRLDAYRLTLSLRAKKTRIGDIVKLLNDKGIPAKYDAVWTWATGLRNPFRKLKLVRRFDGNLVELVGMTVGDGSWNRIFEGPSYSGGRVWYVSVDRELAVRAGRLMAVVLGRLSPYRPIWSDSGHAYVVACGSKHLVELLQEPLKGMQKLIWNYRIRFLKGAYNAEGSVTIRSRRSRFYPRVYFTNSDWEILNTVRRMLGSIGIRTTLELNTKAGKEKSIRGVKTVTRFDVYNICIGTRQGVLAFAKLIGFDIKRKHKLLRRAGQAATKERQEIRSTLSPE